MLLGNVKSTEDPRKHMQSAMEHYELAAAALRSTIVDQLAGVSGCEAFLASVKDAKPETMQVEAAVASSASASAAEVAVEAGTQWVMKVRSGSVERMNQSLSHAHGRSMVWARACG